MMSYTQQLAVTEVRQLAREIETQRDRADRLTIALRDISRKRIMDSTSAINMRAIALAALAVESKS